jgi:hypothetical protein
VRLSSLRHELGFQGCARDEKTAGLFSQRILKCIIPSSWLEAVGRTHLSA